MGRIYTSRQNLHNLLKPFQKAANCTKIARLRVDIVNHSTLRLNYLVIGFERDSIGQLFQLAAAETRLSHSYRPRTSQPRRQTSGTGRFDSALHPSNKHSDWLFPASNVCTITTLLQFWISGHNVAPCFRSWTEKVPGKKCMKKWKELTWRGFHPEEKEKEINVGLIGERERERGGTDLTLRGASGRAEGRKLLV